MSSREYFSLRYAVPGFVFILIVVGLNYYPIVEILKGQGTTEVFGVVLSFLSLFAGSAIGFLIAQVWFLIFHYRRGYTKWLRPLEDDLAQNMGWIGKKALREKIEKMDKKEAEEYKKKRDVAMASSLDYTLLTMKDSDLWKFFQRKVDLFHIMSSTLISLIVGIVVGFISRLFIQFIFYGNWIEPFFVQATLTLQAKTDILLFSITLISAVFFIWVLRYLRNEVFFEYHPVIKLMINSPNFLKKLEEHKKALSKVFADEGFFSESVPNEPH